MPGSPPLAGIPSGGMDAVLGVVRGASGPIRRRQILEELERRGHRISLAGLNRILQVATDRGWLQDSPDGLRPGPPPP